MKFRFRSCVFSRLVDVEIPRRQMSPVSSQLVLMSRVQSSTLRPKGHHFDGQKKCRESGARIQPFLLRGDCNREPGFHRGDVFCDGKYACHLKRWRSWWEIVATLVRCQMNHHDIWPIDGCFQRLMTPQNLSKSISWSDGGRSSVPGVSVIFGHTQIRPDACRGVIWGISRNQRHWITHFRCRVFYGTKNCGWSSRKRQILVQLVELKVVKGMEAWSLKSMACIIHNCYLPVLLEAFPGAPPCEKVFGPRQSQPTPGDGDSSSKCVNGWLSPDNCCIESPNIA